MKQLTLRDWQNDALTQATDKFSLGKKLFLTHATPGGGKTIHGLSVFDSMVGKVTHAILLAPSTTLVDQWMDDAKLLYDFEFKPGMLYNTASDFSEYNGIVMTYQAMNENHENLRLFCANNDVLVIADEIHHVADGKSWGNAFRNAFDPAPHILALTGTPWASNGRSIAFVEYGSDGYAIPDISYSKENAILDKVCRITEFNQKKATDLVFVNNYTGEIAGEFETLQDALDRKFPKAYRKTLQSLKHMKSLFVDADEQLNFIRTNGIPDAGGLIVAPDIETAHKFQDELYTLTGQEYRIVHSKMQKAKESIAEYRKSTERWLISVDMVTEGVDIKRLQVCVFLSTKNTELFIRQVIGRVERRRYPKNEVDKYAYFYYTDVDEIREIAETLIQENKAGLALQEHEDAKEQNPDLPPPPPRHEQFTLEEIQTEQAELIVNGFHYPDDVVIEAMKRRRSQPNLLSDLPLYVICKVILAERAVIDESTSTEYVEDYRDAPLAEKKKRIRRRISDEVNRKLGVCLGRKPIGKEIGIAHAYVNRSIGIMRTDDSISLDLFERKLEYITETEAQLWMS